MTDLALSLNDFGADLILENGDAVADNGLSSAVIVSLFSDARAPVDAPLPQDEVSRRGWWGNNTITSNIGSLLWLIAREKTTQEIATRAQEYCIEALQWMINDNIAARVDVETLLVRPLGLQIKIAIYRGDKKEYQYLWDAVINSPPLNYGNTSIQIIFI